MMEEKIEKILSLLEKRIKWHSAASGVSQSPEHHIYILNELTILRGDFLRILIGESSEEDVAEPPEFQN
jgi:hypothetical protein